VRIAARLRREIVRGERPPGSRLPTRDQIAATFSASKATVQRALDELVNEGLVNACGPLGTYVRSEPPHIEYGLVFEFRPTPRGPWTKFWRTLEHQALAVDEKAQRSLSVNFAGRGKRRDEDFEGLLAKVEAHRLHGLIFASPPFSLLDTPVVSTPEMPRVGIFAAPVEGIPCVWVDGRSFCQRAVEHLHACGRRRLGVIGIAGVDGRFREQDYQDAAAENGLVLEPFCIQSCHQDATASALRATQVLMKLPPDLRPDCLVVTDDNLVEHALAGLIAAGVRVPDDVEVVAHTNFPLDGPAGLPVRRLGYDCRRILRECVDILDRQRGDAAVAAATLIPAQFEHEIKNGDPLL